jgi:flagellin-like protein
MRFSLKQKKRSAVSPVIATLLLIAIAVAAAIIVYAFVTGLIGGLTSSGASLVVVSGSLTVPTGSGLGTLVVTVNNKASNAINYVTITTDSSDGTLSISYLAQDGGIAGGSTAGTPTDCVLAIGNVAPAPAACVGVGSGAPADAIPIGSSASTVGTASLATAGTTYTFSVYSYIGAATTPNIQTFSVTAQI